MTTTTARVVTDEELQEPTLLVRVALGREFPALPREAQREEIEEALTGVLAIFDASATEVPA